MIAICKVIWANVLLKDGKIKSWQVSENKKVLPIHFYYDFYIRDEVPDFSEYVVTSQPFQVTEKVTISMIYDILAPNWMRQFELADDFEGNEPYV